MNKSELVQAVAEKKPGLSKKDVTELLEAFLSTISDTLADGDQVALVGFGTFSVKHRAARKGVNPQTGVSIDIKATNVPSFKAGKALKDSCNSVLEGVN